MLSKKTIPVIGLHLDVYGLEEYLLLEKNTPVSVMLALHGRLNHKNKMEPIAQELCKLNQYRKKGENHILVVAFDAANHGSRIIDRAANLEWFTKEGQNPTYAVDMWTIINSTSRIVSELIDVLDYYLFGPSENYRVKLWGVLGFSMGAHTAFIAAANDPRITVVITVAGISNFFLLMEGALIEANLPLEVYLPKPLETLMVTKMANLDEKLKAKHVLILNGTDDGLVKPQYNESFIQGLRKIHVGKEGIDWKYIVLPGIKHEWVPEMTEACIDWTYQWMIKNTNESKL